MKGGDKGETKDEEVVSTGLLGGITAYHLRMLTENPWEGGAGYTPQQVAEFTVDQVWSRLCEKNILKKEIGTRTQKMEGLAAVAQTNSKDGSMKGRSSQGEDIVLRPSGGGSKASMLRDGTYEGWAINATTGQKEWITPKNKQVASKPKRVRK